VEICKTFTVIGENRYTRYGKQRFFQRFEYIIVLQFLHLSNSREFYIFLKVSPLSLQILFLLSNSSALLKKDYYILS